MSRPGRDHEEQDPPPGPVHAGRCEIRVEGHLDPRWAAWFDGLRLTHEADGTTSLRGPVVDQAALHGLLHKVRDLGVPLISVTHVAQDQSAVHTTGPPRR